MLFFLLPLGSVISLPYFIVLTDFFLGYPDFAKVTSNPGQRLLARLQVIGLRTLLEWFVV